MVTIDLLVYLERPPLLGFFGSSSGIQLEGFVLSHGFNLRFFGFSKRWPFVGLGSFELECGGKDESLSGFIRKDLMGFTVLKVLVGCFVLISICGVSYGSDRDIACLQSIKDTLQNPHNYLSWNFHNSTPGFICKFPGVDCWHPDEKRVLQIKLQNMGLKGPFPRGLQNCSSMIILDLSSNELYGPLPDDIAHIIPYATSLVLSSNYFSGYIPEGVANLTFLNELKLDHNRFTGQIPPLIGQLSRMKSFSVANNLLSGPVPRFTNVAVTDDSYTNNPGLCGEPLDPCQSKEKNQTAVIAGAAVRGVTVAAIILGICFMAIYIRRAT